MTGQPHPPETQESLPKQPFLALGTAALWFFAYILVHETVTAWHQETSSPIVQELQLSAEVSSTLPDDLGNKLKVSYLEGAKQLGKCIICHDIKADNDHAPRFGPLIERPLDTIAGDQDYAYSAGLKAMASVGEPWTVQQLWAFVHDPVSFAGTTRMPFPGIKGEKGEENLRDLLHYFAWSCGSGCESPVLVKLDTDALKGRVSTDLTHGDCTILAASFDDLSFDPFEDSDFLLIPKAYAICKESPYRALLNSSEQVLKRLRSPLD